MGAFLNGLCIGTPFRSFLEEIPKISLVAVQAMVVQFQDAVADIFQKVPVVGDHEKSGAHGRQPLLEPRDHVQVQVVGGLVEDQKVWGLEQHLRKRHAPFFPATERGHWAIELVKVELPQNLTCPRLKIPRLMRIHRIVGLLQSLTFCLLGQCAFVFTHGLDGGAVSDVQRIEDAGIRQQLQFLLQMTVTNPRCKHHTSLVCRFLTTHCTQKGGFA